MGLIQIVYEGPGRLLMGNMLQRVLGVPLLVGYGLGVIIGAGIYVLVGPVIAVAGPLAPLSFLLAGVTAGLAGLCYAELSARFPEAAGAAAYVKEAFRSDLMSWLTGLAVTVVTLTSTAAVARGSVGYTQEFLPLPMPVIVITLVGLCTVLACLGVRESVSIAAAMTVVEIGGLLVVIAAGAADIPDAAEAIVATARSEPASASVAAVVAGTFLSFFAYIGFENLANMAEEARDKERTLPRALLLSIGISTLLYILVAAVAAAAAALNPAHSLTPLLEIGAQSGWLPPRVFAFVALIAVSNGVLIEILMLSRLLYGMAHRGWLPGWLGAVHERTTSPVPATLVAGGAVLVLALGFDTSFLAGMTSAITLLVFTAVSGALWRLQRLAPRTAGFAVSRIVPPLAGALCLALAVAQIFIG